MGEKDIRISISRRSVAQVAPYESEEASASVELSLDADTSAEEVIAQLKGWGDRIATANFEALGIGYEIDEVAVRRLQKKRSRKQPESCRGCRPVSASIRSNQECAG